MAISNSVFLVSLIVFCGVLFPLLRAIARKEKIGSEEITCIIIHVMLFYPIPGLLLTNRQMIPIGNQSVDDMFIQFETGLASEIIFINYLLLLYLIILNVWLFFKRGKIFSFKLILENKWILFLLILNIGISIQLSEFINIFLFINFLLFGKFNHKQISYISNLILFLFIYCSLFLIVLKPESTIFYDGSWSGIFTNPNGVVLVSNFTLILLLLLPFFNLNKSKWTYFHCCVLFISIFMSGSRIGLLTFFAILCLYYFYVFNFNFIKLIFIVLLIPVFYFILFNLNSFDFVSLTSNRILVWNFVLNKYSSSILTGLGSDFFDLENRIKNFPDYLLFATSSYSSFIDYIIFYGVAGAVIITAFMISLFRRTKRIHNVFIMFFLLFLIPNLFESFFRPPYFNLNNVIFLLALFIINNARIVSLISSENQSYKVSVNNK